MLPGDDPTFGLQVLAARPAFEPVLIAGDRPLQETDSAMHAARKFALAVES